MPALHATPARTSALLSRSRRELPRNVRRANLAESVARRAELRPDLTPTPAPTVVSCAPVVEAAPAPEATRSNPLIALLLLAVAACFAISRGLAGIPLQLPPRETVFAMLSDIRDRATAARSAVEMGRGADEEPDRLPQIRRSGHVSVPGGILVLPSAFRPAADGSFDLLIHFHGNTAVVRESADVAGLNAAVVIINLGIGSAPYEEYYAVPGTYEELLETARAGVARRGVTQAKVRRVALSGWSAGYGAISTILQVRKKTEQLDAVLMFDGIHCGWENGALNARQMKPFAELAAQAASGEIYFGLTHSAIDPRTYASTSATSDYLLAKVGARREARSEADTPDYLELESMKGAVSKKLEKRLLPTGEARVGQLHVLGYQGETKEDHMAHLFQMGATLLPELVARWRD